MSVGKSGRIVLEIDPELKQRLYSTLALENKTLKEWFILTANYHIRSQQQPGIFDALKREQQ
jgi:redox-regulated HSP33 family molecular chaperone